VEQAAVGGCEGAVRQNNPLSALLLAYVAALAAAPAAPFALLNVPRQ